MTQDNQIRSTYVDMTPELAQKYLDTQLENRKLNQKWVVALTQLIKRGEWILDGNSIKMDENGHLIDGQHRLHAVIQSGAIVPMEIKSGFPHSAINVIDTFAKNRNTSDVLSLNGIPNSSAVGGGIYIYCSEVKRKVHTGDAYYRPTPTLVLGIYEKNPNTWQECARAGKLCANQSGDKLRLLRPTHITGYMGYLILEKGYSYEKVSEFFSSLCSSSPASNVSIEKLRTTLLKNALSTRKYPSTAIRNMVVKTWNAYITGAPLKNLQVKADEARVEFI